MATKATLQIKRPRRPEDRTPTAGDVLAAARIKGRVMRALMARAEKPPPGGASN